MQSILRPEVHETIPTNGSTNINPLGATLLFSFDESMMETVGWSFIPEKAPIDVAYSEWIDERTFKQTLGPLESSTEYGAVFHFTNTNGIPYQDCLFYFETE